jgi:hypothetical protein
MKINSPIILLAFMSIALFSCTEPKETAASESETTTETTTTSDTENMENMEKINPDGSINATLTCDGNTAITTFMVDSKNIANDNFVCRIAQQKGLTISFKDQAQGIELFLFLHGAGSLPIKTGKYGNSTTGSEQYATAAIINTGESDIDLGAFGGEVIIVDYGMSSNIVCGSFNLTDNNGNKYIGTFNETVSSF